MQALSGGRTGKGAKMSVGMMPTPYGHIPLAKSVPGSEQVTGHARRLIGWAALYDGHDLADSDTS